MCLSLLFIGLTMIYSLAYSTAADWMRKTIGMTDLGGAISLKFVKDGVTLSTNAQPTWVCILNAPWAAASLTR